MRLGLLAGIDWLALASGAGAVTFNVGGIRVVDTASSSPLESVIVENGLTGDATSVLLTSLGVVVREFLRSVEKREERVAPAIDWVCGS